jgi:hypothetical protein
LPGLRATAKHRDQCTRFVHRRDLVAVAFFELYTLTLSQP